MAPPSFPAIMPPEKPADRELSAAMHRLYDLWTPTEDKGNPFHTNFKYTRLTGLEGVDDRSISRRDPSKVLRIDGTYYVWYTCRRTKSPPVGPERADDATPSTDWDLAEVWYATSKDGFHWTEQGRAVERPPQGEYGGRSNCTPDILVWGGKYYLYYQAYSKKIRAFDACDVTMAEADSPNGPWRAIGRPVVDQGESGAWDEACIHDPFPLVYQGRIWLYYKGQNHNRSLEALVRAQGVAIADHPAGPFEKPAINPLLNSGHETCLWPYEGGIAALLILDGAEKNTVQFAPDGLNFEMKSHVAVPPLAPGPFVPDAYADNGDGRGISWGLCHINPAAAGYAAHSMLARFDCDLSRDVDRPAFRHKYAMRFEPETYFKGALALPDHLRTETGGTDRDTVMPNDA